MLTSVRRAALVWNHDTLLTKTSFPMSSYAAALKDLGIETVTVCPSGVEAGYGWASRTFDRESELAAPRFWKDLRCDAAMIVTWHRMTHILEAMRTAEMRIVNVVESDGRPSIRDYPLDALQYRWYGQPTIRGKLAAFKFWMQRYLNGLEEDLALLKNAAASDVVAVANQSGVEDFQRTLKRLHASESLLERVQWVPYPVSKQFCSHSNNSSPRHGLIAVGRWDAAQKNPQLLAGTLRHVLAARPGTRVTIIGPGSEMRFAALRDQFPSVVTLGSTGSAEIRGLMSNYRTLILSSRWESGPIVVSEMLALGGTIVSTPIPTVARICRDRRFGRVSIKATARSLCDAVLSEIEAWDRGERNPDEIAAYWRRHVCPNEVASRLLRLLA